MSAKIESTADIKELALMSIGTDKGSWRADPNFGSEIWLLKQNGKLDGNTAGTLARMIRECLAWLVSDGLCKSITVDAERKSKYAIAYAVTLTRPDGESIPITEVWSGV